jgi:hypothetical protein
MKASTRVIEVYPGVMKASTGVMKASTGVMKLYPKSYGGLPIKLWRFTPKVMEIYPGVIEA